VGIGSSAQTGEDGEVTIPQTAGEREVWTAQIMLQIALDYRRKITDRKAKVLNESWAELGKVYTNGIWVRAFNPKMIRFWENNKVPTRESIREAAKFLFISDLWKLQLSASVYNHELNFIQEIIRQCEEGLGRKSVVIDKKEFYRIVKLFHGEEVKAA
jgi:hypothetical protein